MASRVWTVRLKHHIKDGLEPGFTVQLTSQVKDWSLLQNWLRDHGYGSCSGCVCDGWWDWY